MSKRRQTNLKNRRRRWLKLKSIKVSICASKASFLASLYITKTIITITKLSLIYGAPKQKRNLAQMAQQSLLIINFIQGHEDVDIG